MKRSFYLVLAALGFWGLVSCTKTETFHTERVVEVQRPSENTDQKGLTLPFVDYSLPVAENEIKVMSYNVENLFDAVPTMGHNDATYLPAGHPLKLSECAKVSNPHYREECEKTDWSESQIKIKIEQLARVVELTGSAPDLLGLVEVETAEVAARLAVRLGMKKENVLLTTGSDGRGINNALLFDDRKLELISSASVPVGGGKKGLRTRDILVAQFRVRATGDILGAYVNHWPSQNNASSNRVQAAQALRSQIELDSQKYGNTFHALALGDFNTIASDSPHPFWSIQDLSWGLRLSAVNDMFENPSDFGIKLTPEQKTEQSQLSQMPQGTYYFRNNWQHLDYFFVTPNLIDQVGMEVQPLSFRIVAAPHASSLFRLEGRSDDGEIVQKLFWAPRGLKANVTAPGDVGASDHYPVVVKLKFK